MATDGHHSSRFSNSGSFAMLAAMRRASSSVRSHQLSNSCTIVPNEYRSRLRPVVPWIGGEQPQQVTVVGCGRIEGVESLLFSVVLTKRLREAVEGIDPLPTGEQRPLSGDFRQQSVAASPSKRDSCSGRRTGAGLRARPAGSLPGTA